MQLGIATGIFFERDILEILPAIKDAGFDTVEIWAGSQKTGEYVHFDWHEQSKVQALSSLLKSLGLRVSSLHAPFSDTLDISSPNEMYRKFAVNETLRTMEVLRYLEGEFLVLHPASNERSMRDRNASFAQSRKSLEELISYAGNFGIKLALENQLPHILGGDVPTLISLIEGFPESLIGICYDTSHANLYPGGRPEENLRRLINRVVTVHISDNYGRNDDHFIPGDGSIHWPSLISVLREHHYPGVFMMEVIAEVNQRDRYATLKSSRQRARQLLGVTQES